MPHFTDFGGARLTAQPEMDSFGSFEPRQAKLLEADRFQGPGNEAHPRFQEINPEASKTVIHPNYRPEADGFMKLGDIKGEFASKAIIHPNFRPEADGFMKLGDIKDEAAEDFAGAYSSSWRDVRDHNHGKFVDGLTNAATEGYTEVEWTYLTDGAPAGLIDPEYDELASVAPAGLIDPEYDELVSGGKQGFEEIKVTYQANGNFNADALVQQVNGTIGYEMQAGHGSAERVDRSAVRGDDDNEGWNCTCVPDLFTQTFEPVAGMDSFGESLKPVPEDGGFQPLEGASVGIGMPPEPKLWLQMLA